MENITWTRKQAYGLSQIPVTKAASESNQVWRPVTRVGLLILRDKQILLGKIRVIEYFPSCWAFLCGKLENGESFEGCALRELREECGNTLKVRNIRFTLLANLKAYTPEHYVYIGLVADWVSGEAVIAEPDRFECWHWFPFDKRQNLFGLPFQYK